MTTEFQYNQMNYINNPFAYAKADELISSMITGSWQYALSIDADKELDLHQFVWRHIQSQLEGIYICLLKFINHKHFDEVLGYVKFLIEMASFHHAEGI
jgi:hypothetical protein